MKTSLALLCTSLVLAHARGQGIGSLFNQKESDLKSVGQQIALLQLYAGWLEKGYRIAETELHAIGQTTGNDLALHTEFFAALRIVNPHLKRYPSIDRITADQLAIVRTLAPLHSVPRLNAAETEFLHQTIESVLNRASDGLTELITLLSDHELTMTDDERITRMDGIARNMRKVKVTALHLSQEIHLLSADRAGEEADLETEKRWQ